MFPFITTLQCGYTCWTFEAGIETCVTLPPIYFSDLSRLRNLMHYIFSFICLHFHQIYSKQFKFTYYKKILLKQFIDFACLHCALSDIKELSSLEELCTTRVAAVNILLNLLPTT